MTNTIQWPGGEFTLQAAVDVNTGVPQGEVKKKLADGIAAKLLSKPKKGTEKSKANFRW